jgi:hypothetical protein
MVVAGTDLAAARVVFPAAASAGALTTRQEGGKIRLHGRNMPRKGFEGEWKPATLGTTARAHLLLRVWCKDCPHGIDIDPGQQAELHGADLPVPDWASRLRCSQCGSRNVDSIVARRSTGGVGRD